MARGTNAILNPRNDTAKGPLERALRSQERSTSFPQNINQIDHLARKDVYR